MIKYIFCDLDGTLMSDDKTISDDNIISIKKAYDSGIKFIPCTGRFDSYGGILEALGIEKSAKDYSIAAGGSVIKQNDGTIIKGTYIDNDATVKLIDLLIKYDSDFFLNGVERRMSFGSGKQMDAIFNGKSPYPRKKNADSKELYDIASKDRIIKIQFAQADKKYMKIITDAMANEFSDYVEFSLSEGEMIEVTKKGCNKEHAFLDLIALLNINIEETLVIGDNGNDLGVLKRGGLSACPNSAIDIVKENVTYVSPFDNNHSAVSDIIENLIFKK